MQCPDCHADNGASARFCQACGRRLPAACAGCGAELGADARFCAQCGQPTTSTTTPSPRPAGSAPGYTPRHLAERILTSRSALEGERKQVTVLFADLVESTSLAERLGPEAMHELLDRVLRLMAEAVHRYDGTVNQFLGDGLMALFGAPVALEDHALRAVYAAFAIQETIAGLAEELRREREADVQVRIGVNTGLVVVGKIGDDLRMDYTAVGDTTNLAARMQAGAAPGTIVVTEATHRLIEPFVRSDALGALTVKGIAAPVAAFRLTGRRQRTRFEASAERGLTPLVGRDRELDLLAERFARAASGRGQIVGIVGEPGAGKSRLVHEFRRRIAPDAAVALQGSCLAWGQSTPYLPITQIVRSSFAIEDADNLLQIDEKLRQGLARLDGFPSAYVAPLRSLVGMAVDSELATLDPKARRQQTFEAIRALTMAASRRRPHVIIIEDLHWADATSDDYLAFVVDSLAAMPVLIVTTSRPGHAVRWGDRAVFTQLALDLLDENGTATLLAERLGVRAVPPELVRLIHDNADGNPLFVEEIAGTLLDRGALRRADGGVTWTGDAVEVPATGRDIIRARIDHLPEPAKRALQAAAVIGREFSPALLALVMDDPHNVGAHLDELKRVALVHETRFFPDIEFTFRHALIQDVAYDSLLDRRRREMHSAVGAAIEALHGERLVEHYEILAHHFSRASDAARAVNYLVKAGDKASLAAAGHEAEAFYRRALPLVAAADIRRRAEVLAKIANIVFFHLSDGHTSLAVAEQALKLFEELGDRPNMIAMHMHIQTMYLGSFGDGAESKAVDNLLAIAALTHDDPDSTQKGLLYQRIAHLYLHRGAPAVALEWARRAVGVFDRLGVAMGTCIGTAMTYTGRVDEGLAYNERNWESVLKSGNVLVIAILGHELIHTLTLLRDMPAALEWGARVRAAMPVPGMLTAMLLRPLVVAYTLTGQMDRAAEAVPAIAATESLSYQGCVHEDAHGVGAYHLRQGRFDEAQRELERVIDAHQQRVNLAAVAGSLLALAELHLRRGDVAGGESSAAKVVQSARDGGNVLLECWALPVVAECRLRAGDRKGAAEAIERGFRLLEGPDHWRGLPAPLHIARGMLHAAEGRWNDAEKDFQGALTLSRRYTLALDEARTLMEWGGMALARGSAGDAAGARDRLAEALAIFERVGAIPDAQQVRAFLARCAAEA